MRPTSASNVTDGNTSSYWESTDGGGTRRPSRSTWAVAVDRVGHPGPAALKRVEHADRDAVGLRQHQRDVLQPDRRLGRVHLQPVHRQHGDDQPAVRDQRPLRGASHRQHRLVRPRSCRSSRCSPAADPAAAAARCRCRRRAIVGGSEKVGSTSSAQTVTVSNSGRVAASVSSVSVSGPFSQTSTCGSSIAAGGSCTVSVKFAPTATGAASGTLSVASSAPGSPLTVALSGTGHELEHRPGAQRPGHGVQLHPGCTAPPTRLTGTPARTGKLTNGAWPSTITVNLQSVQTLGSITIDLPPSSAWNTRTQTLSVLGSTNGTSFSTLVFVRHLHLESVYRQHGHHPAPVGHQRPVRGAQFHRQQRPERRPGL